jgi:fructokinase
MRKIYGIGETVYDIIFKNGAPQAAKPGGSVLNALVSLGRSGLPVSFISEYGSDRVGLLIDSFLNDNGVTTSTAYHYNDANTSLALAFLDENNNAQYTFFKDFPEKRLDIDFPVARPEDILLCGSFYAVWSEIRSKFWKFVSDSNEKGALVIYDPNFRKSHASELDKLRPLILDNMRMATIVRGSDEDFREIFGAADADEAWSIVSKYSKCMVYTASSEAVFVRSNLFSGRFPVKKIKPVSTIGAGDNFNAGMIASIYRNGISRNDIPVMGEDQWKKIIESGVAFASEVCLSYDNYISTTFASRYRSASRDQL